MEMNTSALVKNINLTSMSELLASSRSPFTEFVHVGSTLDSNSHLNIGGGGSSTTNSSTPSSSTSSTANIHSISGQAGSAFNQHYHLHQQFSSSTQQDDNPASNMFPSSHKNLMGHLPNSGAQDSLQHNHSSLASSNILLNNNTSHSQIHSSSSNNNENNFSNNSQPQQMNHNYMTENNNNSNNTNMNNPDNSNNNTNIGNANSTLGNNSNNNSNGNSNKNDSSNGNSNNPSNQQHTRLTQPTRTQIPIHCFIEQLDACADMPGYSPSLTDTDLFNTVDTNQYTKTSPNSSNNPTHINQPHLHQSKLALESVTNCTTFGHSTSSFNQQLLASTSNNGNANHTSGQSNHNQQSNSNKPSSNLNNNLQQLPRCRDKIAIVTSNVLFIDLVRAVLPQLGYTAMDLINAKGKLILGLIFLSSISF